MILLRPHVWGKSGSRVKYKNSVSQSDCRIFILYLKNYWRYNLHAGTYLLKLQIDDVILYEWSQACQGMPKDVIKTLKSQKLKEV